MLAGLYQDWLSGADALVIGACVSAAAPLGDLFESLIKRDSGVKDSGRFFGEHGGALDRLDAAFSRSWSATTWRGRCCSATRGRPRASLD